MRFRHLLFLALPVWTVAASASCGSDDSSGNGEGTDGVGDASAGTDGSAGSTGGTSGRGGTGVGAAPGDGSVTTGGRGGSGGSGGDGGPQCTPREQVPDPVYTSITAESSCLTRTPCGGAIAEGEWSLTEACIADGNLFPQILARCSAATIRSSVDAGSGGDLTIGSGEITLSFHATLTATVDFPSACTGCRCADLERELQLAGLTDLSCGTQCAGTSCFCTISETINVTASGPFTTQGTELATGSNRTFDYCVAGGELTLQESSGDPVLTFRPTRDIATPEICDGVDNDQNGQADDGPVECPESCNTEGVCAEVNVLCGGSSGWTCEYTSPVYESGGETLCDELDNDCDGFVDEELPGCSEICNGVDDNDNNIVDDNPRDQPTCPTVTGVCAQGVSATCGGTEGWQCAYTSTDFEETESTCDGLDNDCDGLTDEGCGCSTGASKVYVLAYTGNSIDPENGIYRANLDGSGVEPIFNLTGSNVLLFQVNPADDRVYYYDFITEELRRVPLGGGVSEPVWTGATQQWAIHPAAARVYLECGLSNICAFDLATPGTVDTVIEPARVSALSIDPFLGKIYWGDHIDTMNRTINRADLDGTRREVVFPTGTYSPGFLALDTHGHRAYTGSISGVSAADLVTKEWTPIYTATGANVEGVVVDTRAGKVYWTENTNGIVRRANLDGSSPEPIITTIVAPFGVDLYLCAP